jgi:hypothetical protein
MTIRSETDAELSFGVSGLLNIQGPVDDPKFADPCAGIWGIDGLAEGVGQFLV